MKKEKSKKWLKYVIIIAVVVAIIAGIITFFVTRPKDEVSVYSVRDVGNENWWENNSNSEGMIKEDKMQSVYLSSTQKVEKVAVKEGQKVKAGDVLLKYNSTLSNLELERKQLDIRKMELQLANAQKELDDIKNYKPGVPTYGSLPAETPIVEPTIGHDTLPELSAPLPAVTLENEMKPAPLTGEGTSEKPYLFVWKQDQEYEKSFIESLIKRAGEGKTEVVALFMIRENNSMTGNLISSSKMKFIKKENDYTFSILGTYTGSENDPLYPSKPEIDNAIQEPEEFPEIGPIYTAVELQKMIIDKEKEISEIALNIKLAKSEYNKLKDEVDNNTVYSNLDGVVKTVLNVDDENIGTKPIIVVSSGGGYYVQGRIGEFDLDKIKIGQKVNVRSYETGNSSEGVIEKLSIYPVGANYYSDMTNSNVSYYPYTVRVDESANFRAGEYASLEIIQEQEKQNSFYLISAFVISENGKYYAYVAGENDKLEKRELNIGKNMHGLLEVRGGITMDDRVAFPYGKNIKDGTPIKDGSLEELYDY